MSNSPNLSELSGAKTPDAEYLPNFQWMKEHIGEVLVQGTAETLLLRPEDPIEYLGQWLAQQVRNVELDQQLLREKAFIQAEQDAKKQQMEERAKLFQQQLAKEQQRKEVMLRAQDEAKAKIESEHRTRELEQMRAERTEHRLPPSFGLPETILEVPSSSNLAAEEQ